MKTVPAEFPAGRVLPDSFPGMEAVEGTELIEPEALSNHFDNLQAVLIRTFLVMNFLKPGLSLKDFLGGLERNIIDGSLAFSAGKCSHAAAILGINPTTLHEKMKRMDLSKNKSDYKQCNILKELMVLLGQLKKTGSGPGPSRER